MVDTVVRPIQDADVAGAAAALMEVHATDGYPVEGVAQPEAWITPPEVVQAWVGEVDHKIVGHVAVMRAQGEKAVTLWRRQIGEDETHIGVLARLFVVQSARKNAVGESLMRAAMDYAKVHGLHLVLDVMDKDTSAIRLYERLGWHFIGEATHQYGAGQQIPAKCYVWPAS
ncbi:GNAT family N-acetyltransferase [Streptomyces sp. NBC_01237]|uniref:GNAT family N-acetyltransferase n=1 Tax=Streptomyces sp. NBC_01237 TaxID=2903790 RepID=UPI002DDAF7C3|nr:GNAT family N-acetyltransferase [Streptomyces sp. NBC_01237]WRZ72387.1 GNAT family N-acetyltransferase [Streptomyces sp. NBC_01237]